MHCLIAIDVCTLNHGIKFCDEEGYNIIPMPESELEKIRWLLKGREDLHLQVPCEAPKRKYCESHRRTRKQGIKAKPTNNQGKE